MKNRNLILALAVFPMVLLSSCSKPGRAIEGDELSGSLAAIEARYLEGCPQKATVYSSPNDYDKGNFTATIDKGHYYHYHSFGMLIFVPIIHDTYYYEKDGLYYHIETSASKNTYEIISEESFKKGMEEGEKFIWERAARMLSLIKQGGGKEESDSTFTENYTTTGEGQLSKSTAEEYTTSSNSDGENVDISAKRTMSINYRNNLPYDWIVESKKGKDSSKYKTSFDWTACEENYPSNVTSPDESNPISWVDRR